MLFIFIKCIGGKKIFIHAHTVLATGGGVGGGGVHSYKFVSLHLQLVSTQQFLAGGGAGGHGDRGAPRDDDRGAGQDVGGHQAHAVGHGS